MIRIVLTETITYTRDYELAELQAVMHTKNGTVTAVVEYIEMMEPPLLQRHLKTVVRPQVEQTWTAQERPAVAY